VSCSRWRSNFAEVAKEIVLATAARIADRSLQQNRHSLQPTPKIMLMVRTNLAPGLPLANHEQFRASASGLKIAAATIRKRLDMMPNRI
jgi:hypothetical protein